MLVRQWCTDWAIRFKLWYALFLVIAAWLHEPARLHLGPDWSISRTLWWHLDILYRQLSSQDDKAYWCWWSPDIVSITALSRTCLFCVFRRTDIKYYADFISPPWWLVITWIFPFLFFPSSAIIRPELWYDQVPKYTELRWWIWYTS